MTQEAGSVLVHLFKPTTQLMHAAFLLLLCVPQELQYGSLVDDAGGWLGWVEAKLPTAK
jgi:hypothetical protein